jgi:hypothetical protein
VLLHLPVCKLEDLEPVGEGCLGGLGLCKIVNDFLVRVSLLDVVVVEINDSVAIREALPLDSVVKNDLFLPTFKGPLDLSVVSDDLLDNLGIFWCFSVVIVLKFHIIVIFFLFI